LRLAFFAIVLFGLALAGVAHAADPVNVEITGTDEQQGRITATISVSSADGRPITGLTPANFRASLNDSQLNVSDVSSGGTGAVQTQTSILLLVDVSGSMYGAYMDQAKQALADFVAGSEPSASLAVMTFSTNVTLVQDFTSDRAAIAGAIGRLAAGGETALYNAVIDASNKIVEAPTGRRSVILLSDGAAANVGLNNRTASLDAARASGVNFIAVGLGSQIDRQYLGELTSATGGRFLEAPTTGALRQAYLDLAQSLRAYYTLVLNVPSTVDRTIAGELSIQVNVRSENGKDQVSLPPLPGAVAPPVNLKLEGLTSGQRIKGPLSLTPTAEGATLTSVEYTVNGEVLHRASSPPFAFDLDPATLAAGNHLLTIVATDDRGRRGELQIPFITVAASSGSNSILIFLAVGVLILGIVGFVGLKLARRIADWQHGRQPVDIYTQRIRPWSDRGEPPKPVEVWTEPSEPAVASEAASDRLLGRVVIMDEAAIKEGNLTAIQEYDVFTQPLTLGTGENCDIQLEDEGDQIALEEARLWVQKGSLVYHKLTTLSAMATEGMTSGWIILEDGEDIRLGRYRLLFRAEQPAFAAAEERTSEASASVQEHGMALRSLWQRVSEEPPIKPTPDQAL
jgi:VWFA-related protein